MSFAFLDVISSGQKENVTVAQTEKRCEIKSREEKLHKLALQSKIKKTEDVMKWKANEENKEDSKEGFLSLKLMDFGRIESALIR